MRGRRRALVAGAFGVLAFSLAAAGADAARAEADRERAEAIARYGGEVTTLVVARTELAEGEELRQTNVVQREWLADLAPKGAAGSLDEVVGKRLTSPVAEGQPICEVDYSAADGGLAVPAGRVAVSVAIGDRTGLAGQAGCGARVQAYEVTDGQTTLVTPDAEVLSVPGARSGQASGTTSEATLAVPPGDVARLLAASSKGSLRLVLPASDVGTVRGGDA